MDLLDIIIFSLKLFALTSLIIVSISYFIFKLKDRSRVKPYMEPNAVETSGTVLRVEEVPVETSNQRYKILNDETISPDKKRIRIEKPVVINKFIAQQVKNPKEAEEELKIFNIFRHYSKNSIEPMHKIKF
jgi:hypothetical protein